MKLKKIFATMLAIATVLPLNIFMGNSIVDSSINIFAEEDTINGISETKYNEMVNQTIYLINEYRKSNGLEILKTSSILQDMANQRAKEQEVTGMSHTRPNGLSCFTIYDDYGVDWSALAENSAAGQTSPESVVECWKNSTYHNENILGDYQYTSIGITYYESVYYWVQMFCSSTDEKIIIDAYIPERVENNSDNTELVTTIPPTTSEIVTTTENQTLKKGDLNEDGKINSADILILKRYILHLITEL
ncbi:MAG: CAP domain-containing protein [Oscillospiraceae bacterium]